VNTAASAAVIVIITITTITAKIIIIIIIRVIAAAAAGTCLHLFVVLQSCIFGTRDNIQLKCFSASQASPLSHRHQNHDQYWHHLSLMTFFFLPTTNVSSPMAMAIPST
jgi:flagellar basal body-associated protein FliL